MGISIDGISSYGPLSAYESAQSDLSTNESQLSSSSSLTPASNPSGVSIDALMRSQASGLQSASANAQTGISLLQTADGGLSNTSSALADLRSLAVKAGNGALDASSLSALGAQATQDIAQIDSIASSTSFNGTNLLNGSTGALSFQTGPNAGSADTTSVNMPNATSSALGLGGIAGAITAGGDMSSVLKSIDGAASSVNASRSTFGAATNALTDTVGNITSAITNSQSSDSSISDTDMAQAVTKMSHDKIKTQVSISLLAQSNGINQQNALALLKVA